MVRMVYHVKTTLNIDDSVMRTLRREAARRGQTMSQLVEAALRVFLRPPKTLRRKLPKLPTFEGQALIDVSDREALRQAFEDD